VTGAYGLAIVAIRVIVAWLAPGLTMLLLTGSQGIPPEFLRACRG